MALGFFNIDIYQKYFQVIIFSPSFLVCFSSKHGSSFISKCVKSHWSSGSAHTCGFLIIKAEKLQSIQQLEEQICKMSCSTIITHSTLNTKIVIKLATLNLTHHFVCALITLKIAAFLAPKFLHAHILVFETHPPWKFKALLQREWWRLLKWDWPPFTRDLTPPSFPFTPLMPWKF